MTRRMKIILTSFLVILGCIGCQKAEHSSILVGTSWECVEEPEILVFNDYHSGLDYLKSATDGIYDENYSSFDFTYEISGKNVKIHVFYSNFDSMYDFVMEDDNLLTCGRFHYKKIQHKP